MTHDATAGPSDASNEPLEVKLIAAASDGYVNVTPEKCERIRRLLSDATAGKAELRGIVQQLQAMRVKAIRLQAAFGTASDTLFEMKEPLDRLEAALAATPAPSGGAGQADLSMILE